MTDALEYRVSRASQAKLDYHVQQLRKFFARANDPDFIQLIWAVDALQSGREQDAKRFLTYPPQAAVASSLHSQFGIHRWELETLLVQLLLTPKEARRREGNLILNCGLFESIRHVVNRLRSLEDVEHMRYFTGNIVRNELHRMGQRQFHWQRGYFNGPQLYRYVYIYGQGQCAEYFAHSYGLAITDFLFAGFGLFSVFLGSPKVLRETSIPSIGLTLEMVQRALPLLSSSLDDAQAETVRMVGKVNSDRGKPIPTSLLPSVFRKTPLIWFREYPTALACPIPELINLRVTSGLYYDLIPGGQGLLNEANDRFEQYTVNLFSAMMPRFETSRACRYGPKGAQVDTPDVLVKDKGKIVVAGECKATKLTYLAQFAEDPFAAARTQYMQIAKGTFQLWRFFSHVRRGFLKEELADDVHAMVFTLDAFMTMAHDAYEKTFAEANALADQDENITPEDRRPITICPVHDLESIFARATEDTFLASLSASYQEQYKGWQLRQIHRDSKAAKDFGPSKAYPFDLEAVLPWWSRFGDEVEVEIPDI